MRALVTGGTGFLGSRLAARLRSQGWDVTALGRSDEAGGRLQREGIRYVRGDLCDSGLVMKAAEGQDLIFHCGALSASWGRYRDFYASNVQGTENVIAACLRQGTGRLVHVSTPSICFRSRNRLAVVESDRLPVRQASPYAATKRIAEAAVLRAAAAGLSAIVLRPRALFGPGDPSILPRLIQANAAGRLPLIGGGRALIDLTYVDNAIDALLLAGEAPASLSGRVYHITNGEPLSFAAAAERLFQALGEPQRPMRLPYPAAYAAAAVMELASSLRPGRPEPLLTRATLGMIGRSQTLDIGAARRELGYEPRISVGEGLHAYAQWWREQAHGQGS